MPRDTSALPTIPSIRELLGKDYTPELEAAFPDVLPPFVPCGYLILVQLRSPLKTSGRIILTDETKDAKKYREQCGLVRAMGPSAYRNRQTLEPWPESDWCRPGYFIRAPMFGGDRIGIGYGDKNDEALFATIRDGDVIGVVTGNPLAIRTIV